MRRPILLIRHYVIVGGIDGLEIIEQANLLQRGVNEIAASSFFDDPMEGRSSELARVRQESCTPRLAPRVNIGWSWEAGPDNICCANTTTSLRRGPHCHSPAV